MCGFLGAGTRRDICSSVPSRSRCPEQRWPRPAAGSWGHGWSPWRWLCVASGHGRAVSPGRPRWCRISAPAGKNARLIWILDFKFCLAFSVFSSFHETCAPTSGRDMTKAWSWAFLAAARTSSMLISRELSPYLMFSAMLQSNKMGSWDTMPILERRKGTLTRVESWPSINCKEQLTLPLVKSSEIINEWRYNPLNELS